MSRIRSIAKNRMDPKYPRGFSPVAVLIIVVVIAIAGAGAGYFLYTKAPSEGEQAIARMIQAMQNIESAQYEGSVSFEGTTQGNTVSGVVAVDGAFASTTEIKHSRTNVSLTLRGLSPQNPDAETTAGFSAIYTPDTSYLKLGDITFPESRNPSIAIMKGIVGSVQQRIGDRWVAIDRTFMEQSTGVSEKSEADKEAMWRIAQEELMKQKPYRITAHGQETVDGSAASHYTVAVDIKEFVATMRTINTRLHEEGHITDEEHAQAGSQFDRITENNDLSAVNDLHIDLWIDVDTDRLRRITLQEYTLNSETEGTIQGELRYYDYNTDVNITEPQNTIPLQQLMQEIMGQMTGGAGGGGLPQGSMPGTQTTQ